MDTRTLVSLPELAAVKVVAVYDRADGQILHLHSVMTFEGGRVISDEEAIATALEYAGAQGHATAKLATALSSNPAHLEGPHRIDPRTREFVALSPPPPPREQNSSAS